jgi:hypothetical protein
VATGDDDANSSNCPSYPPVLAAYMNMGRAVFTGDITPLHPGYFPSQLDEEEQLLLINTAIWLATGLPIAVEEKTWGHVKFIYR